MPAYPRLGASNSVREIHSESAKEEYVGEAIDDVLHEVQAARHDLRLTCFCLRQVEAIRRIDRVTAGFADLVPRGTSLTRR
jgi:hypothetical protein